MKAYFTVEAACIIPVVLGIYVFLIYGMFYQYDRCLLEQDVALLALREQWADADGTETEIRQTQGTDQYLAFELQEDGLKKEKGKIHAWAEGTVDMPLSNLIVRNRGNNWKLEASFSYTEMNAAEWIRLSRKIMEEIGNVAD